jgi:hypothetical protein
MIETAAAVVEQSTVEDFRPSALCRLLTSTTLRYRLHYLLKHLGWIVLAALGFRNALTSQGEREKGNQCDRDNAIQHDGTSCCCLSCRRRQGFDPETPPKGGRFKQAGKFQSSLDVMGAEEQRERVGPSVGRPLAVFRCSLPPSLSSMSVVGTAIWRPSRGALDGAASKREPGAQAQPGSLLKYRWRVVRAAARA